MSPSGSKSGKPKASDVAAEAKKYFIPLIRREHYLYWPTHSRLYKSPLAELPLPERPGSLEPPAFHIRVGDPVDVTLEWTRMMREYWGSIATEASSGPTAAAAAAAAIRIPLVCAANERRPGGDWETGVIGYEERLCRRSNLSATLSTPQVDGSRSGGGDGDNSHYPIPIAGGIYSPHVVVFRGPHDRYEKYAAWASLPVISLPPARWPKLTANGTKYSFEEEREVVRNKIRAVLRICLEEGCRCIAVGDFGLGNGYRNPPREMAEMWRDTFLYDPAFRGQFREVCFVFEDPNQSTTRYIIEDIAKKARTSSSRTAGSSSGSAATAAAVASVAAAVHGAPTDYGIFSSVFHAEEIRGVLSRPDPRYGLGMITS